MYKFFQKTSYCCLMLTAMVATALAPLTAHAASSTVDITGKDIATIQTDIQTALSGASSGETVTVTGAVTGAATGLTLNIPTGVTVVWQASLEGSASTLVDISGGGTLDVAAGGLLKTSSNYQTIRVRANTTVKVSGGTVEATASNGKPIKLNNTGAKAEVTAGEVKGVNYGIECTAQTPGTIISLSGGTVSKSGSSATGALEVYSSARVEISDNAIVKGNIAIYVNSLSTTVVYIKGGTIAGPIQEDSGTVNISGGTVSNPNGNVIGLYGSSNVVISGGTITGGNSSPIYRDSKHKGSAYYTGDYSGLFNSSFVAETNLFRLDAAVQLSTADGVYSYNANTAVYKSVVATLSPKLDLTEATVTVSAGDPTINASANTVTFDKTVKDAAITIAVTDAKIVGTDIPVQFTTEAFGVNVNFTGLLVNGAGNYQDISVAASAIMTALENNTSVTVTGAIPFNVTQTLNLDIPNGKTVVWQAALVGVTTVVNISGGGTLDVATGGSLRAYGSTSTIDVVAGTLRVSGGMVEAIYSSTAAIKLTGAGAKADITAGEVKAVYRAIDCQNGGSVSVSGGAVNSKTADIATIMVSGASTVEISGTATIRNTVTTGSRTIQVASGSTAAVSITGGTVIGQSLIYGGTMHISGGSVYIPTGNALTLYESGNAVITGGTVRVLANGTQQIITRDNGHNGAGYYIGTDFYIGDRAKLFSGFTPGTNLFKLDGAPALTAGGGGYTYSSTTPSDDPVVATLSDKLDLTGAIVTASAGNPTVNKTANTVTFDKTVNVPAITLTVTGAKFAGTNIPFDFTTAAFGVNIDAPTYGVSIATLENGKVELDKNPADYAAGETVTLTVTPAEGYELETISAYKTGDEGTSVTLDGTGNSRTFTMPAYGVTVTATFGITITTGINEIHNNTPARITGYFNILGQKLPQEPQSGVYIIMYDNGKTDKRIK